MKVKMKKTEGYKIVLSEEEFDIMKIILDDYITLSQEELSIKLVQCKKLLSKMEELK